MPPAADGDDAGHHGGQVVVLRNVFDRFLGQPWYCLQAGQTYNETKVRQELLDRTNHSMDPASYVTDASREA